MGPDTHCVIGLLLARELHELSEYLRQIKDATKKWIDFELSYRYESEEIY